ncbi:MAG: thioredoxin [Alteromonadaceae bacterium]|nr:thioredoxin [Alteromonadaceae bacterium]
MSNRVTTIAVVAWAVAILAALMLANLDQIKMFDPQMKLAQAASQPNFDQQFTADLSAAGVKPGSLVHIRASQRCYCNTLTEPHQQELSQALAANGYQVTQVSLTEHPQLTQYIDAFPALAVVDKQGKLRYVGPYAIGYGCFTGNNLVAEISQLATASEYFGASVNSDAKGCFCAV